MTLQISEFTDILDRWGDAPEAWPASAREACEQLLRESEEARQLLRQQRRLHEELGQMAVPAFPGLEARVLNQPLPPQRRPVLEALLQWLLPEHALGKQLWRPVLAACLPLVFGILVGNFFSFGVTAESPGFEYWDDELYVLSLNDYTENLF